MRNNPESWIKTGTRFNSVRRFGYRLSGVKWVEVSLSDYLLQSRKLQEFIECSNFLFDACLWPAKVHDKYLEIDFNWVKNTSLRSSISKVIKANNDFDTSVKQLDRKLIARRHNPGALGNSKSDIELSYRRSLAKVNNMRDARVQAVAQALRQVKSVPMDDWAAMNMRKDAIYARATLEAAQSFMKDPGVFNDWAAIFLEDYFSK